MVHLTRDHKDFLNEFYGGNNNTFPLLAQGKFPKAKTIYCWLDWLSIGLPFNFCEKEETRKYFNVKEFSSITLTNYMTKTVKLVEKRLKKPSRTNSPWWSMAGQKWEVQHFMLALMFFPSKAGQTKYFFLALAPLVDETPYTAGNHLEMLEFVLSVYNKSLENVRFIVCYNEDLNKSIARKMGKLMTGCSSHRLNLAVKSTYLKFSDGNELVNKLMKKLSTLQQSAILRQKFSLRPVLKN